MKAITNEYLADIILRQINGNIRTHRANKNNFLIHENLPCATDAELLDFIQTIPYFHETLKDFLVGNLTEETIIISQSWELEFLKKTILWAESFEWLHGSDYFLTDAHINSIKKNISSLSLPY
jgi:hypothetical protein